MVGGAKKKSKIVAILNKYNDTLDRLINSSDIESLDHSNSLNWLGLIDKGSRNTLKSKNNLLTFLEKDYLDKNISITLFELVPKIQDFQIHQYYNIATRVTKSKKS